MNKTEPNGAPVFWGRGNGWAISSFAQALQQLPPSHPHAAEFAGKLRSMAGALKAVQVRSKCPCCHGDLQCTRTLDLQGADGLWRSSLLDAAHYPNPETTGTACFTYAIAYGINAGLLDAATYTPVVAAAWQGLASISLQVCIQTIILGCSSANVPPSSIPLTAWRSRGVVPACRIITRPGSAGERSC